MKIAILGANGNVGSVLVDEALSRGYEVLALVKDKNNYVAKKGVEVKEVDALSKDTLVNGFKDIKIVVSAFGPKAGFENDLVVATRNLVDAAKRAKVERFLMVGGAGSLFVSEGVILANSGALPADWLPVVNAHVEALNVISKETDLNWTVLRPSSIFGSGEKTGKFRLGTDYLLVDSEGNSHISFQDYAVALFDELDNSDFIKKAFTVGY
ncbi:3-beta hydroxysteroid dehydrogenase [Clostridium gelidum]|uniref:3-beta hydroxysteroid dehydrogenase n=1 Tax=Clostridium gelidum TaxID=704125 RepID=A0ABM7T185_9CLOT|nr:NAD(P)H-binding protein [Clostridium gelidum]BCZ45672.1 3-beta hydroxysteroid dehydrogenase [Clostridium gelidum]